MHNKISLRIQFDPAKSERNRDERGLPFDLVVAFDFETALYIEDRRQDYGEARWSACGWLKGRLHVLVFTEVGGDIRVISLRKANRREERRYAEAPLGRSAR